MKKQTVFVGLSGGVDSAVSAALLQKKGYEVVGVFIRTWHPEFLACNEEDERRDAMRIAAHLDIPFLTFDLEKVYKKEVGEYMINEYKKGRTPNPDVMCNKEVKFGAFLKKALGMGALVRPSAEIYVATGHYAQISEKGLALGIQKGKTLGRNLYKGADPAKDQSYFLWTLTQRQLSKIIFPVGGLKKEEVRKLAKKFKLPVAEKKDSQGICFLGPVDLKKFLSHYIKPKKGKVLLARQSLGDGGDKGGGIIGHHGGAAFFTLGERHGFTITKKTSEDKRYYIVAKNLKKNVLVVSNYPLRPSDTSPYSRGRTGRGIRIENTNWISKVPDQSRRYIAQIRYHGELLPCQVKVFSKNKAEVVFDKPVLAASGQSIVIYSGAFCLGGGVVV